jgi:hypothetical protein
MFFNNKFLPELTNTGDVGQIPEWFGGNIYDATNSGIYFLGGVPLFVSFVIARGDGVLVLLS